MNSGRRHSLTDVKPPMVDDVTPGKTGVRPTGTREILLVTTLQVAVPMWIVDMAAVDPTNRADRILLETWRREAADVISGPGSETLTGFGGQKGEAAKAFNGLARGIALLATQPGGCFVFGLIWCAKHSPAGQPPTADWDRVCPQCCAEDLAAGMNAVGHDADPERPVVTADIAGGVL